MIKVELEKEEIQKKIFKTNFENRRLRIRIKNINSKEENLKIIRRWRRVHDFTLIKNLLYK